MIPLATDGFNIDVEVDERNDKVIVRKKIPKKKNRSAAILNQDESLLVDDKVYKKTNDASGELSVAASGGSSPYIYLWSNSATTTTISIQMHIYML